MKPTLPTLLLAATLATSGLVARAQGYGGGMAGNIYTYQVPIRFPIPLPIPLDVPDSQPQTSKNIKRKASTRPIRRTPKEVLTTTTYRESPAVSKRVLKGFTDWIATKANATDAEAIRRDFENDIVGRWAKEVRENGLKRGDVADALTAYWVTNWMIANRVTSDPKPVQVRAVRRLFASVLSSTPAFAKATNAQRQEMAEAYIYNTVLQGGAFGQVFHTGDKALIKRFSDGRAASFKTEMGFDLRTVKLTNAGFAAKS